MVRFGGEAGRQIPEVTPPFSPKILTPRPQRISSVQLHENLVFKKVVVNVFFDVTSHGNEKGPTWMSQEVSKRLGSVGYNPK